MHSTAFYYVCILLIDYKCHSIAISNNIHDDLVFSQACTVTKLKLLAINTVSNFRHRFRFSKLK